MFSNWYQRQAETKREHNGNGVQVGNAIRFNGPADLTGRCFLVGPAKRRHLERLNQREAKLCEINTECVLR